MALLSNIMRSQAVWGRTDTLDAWVMGRQGGRWAQQTARAAMRPRTSDPEGAVRELEELHRRGVVSDAEFQRLRAGLPA